MQTNLPNMGQMYTVGHAHRGANVSLYVIAPKHHVTQVRRAHNYNFDPGFVDDLQTVIHDASTRDQNILQASRMVGSQHAPTAILPNGTGVNMDLRVFSELWSFFLVIDMTRGMDVLYPQQNLVGGNISPLSFDTRYIYSGYFSEEPFAMGVSNLGSGPTPNHAASLLVTHHTVIAKDESMSASGGSVRWNPVTDLNIIPTHTAIMTSNTPIHLMTPYKLASTIGSAGDGTHMVFDGINTQITPQVDSLPTIAANNAVKHTSTDIVSSLVQASVHTANIGATGTMTDQFMYGSDVFANVPPTAGIISDTFVALLGERDVMAHRSASPIDPNKGTTVGELLRTYPNLNVIKCSQPFNSAWDAHDPGAPNILNVLSSMISSTVPVVLANYGLADISFRYRSRPLTQSAYTLSQEPECALFGISGLVQSPEPVLRAKYKILIDHLRYNLFPSILLAAGDFDLTLSCSVAGTSLIELHFLDTPSLSFGGAYFETNNALGGLSSPILGTNDEFRHNADELGRLIGAISGAMGTPSPVTAGSLIQYAAQQHHGGYPGQQNYSGTQQMAPPLYTPPQYQLHTQEPQNEPVNIAPYVLSDRPNPATLKVSDVVKSEDLF